MNVPAKPNKPSSKLILTTCMSGGLNLVLSVAYVVFSLLAIVYRFDCNAVSLDSSNGSVFFLITIYRVYIQEEQCDTSLTLEGVTGDYAVFVLASITLAASLLMLIAAIVLIFAMMTNSKAEYIKLFVYGYVGICIASLIVDITFATHFGLDYSYLTGVLNSSSPGLSFNYQRDMIRLGAFVMMTLSLKGFVGHIINVVLLILIIIFLIEYTNSIQTPQHPIHKLSVIKAFDNKKRNDCHHQCEICQNYRGPQLNHGYNNDEILPRNSMRTSMQDSRNELSNPNFDRSYSWQPGPGSGSAGSAQPFSYLEDVKRPVPVRAPTSPAVDLPWRRDWQPGQPHVPAPDYSPNAPRRLKPALKSYM